MRLSYDIKRKKQAMYWLLHAFFPRSKKHFAAGISWTTNGTYWSKKGQEPKFFWYDYDNQEDMKFIILYIGYMGLAFYYKDLEGPKMNGRFRFNM